MTIVPPPRAWNSGTAAFEQISAPVRLTRISFSKSAMLVWIAGVPTASTIKVAVLYVAEVLLLRYMLDDQQQTNEAQDRTTEALAVKML